MSTVSVIIPAYGRCPHLPGLIDALLSGNRAPDEVVVSHSGPDDPTGTFKARSGSLVVLHDPVRRRAVDQRLIPKP